jgi:hypothetical protein
MRKHRSIGMKVRTLVGEIMIAVRDDGAGKDLHFSNGFQFWHFAAADRVVEALREAGATDLSIKPA